MNVVVEGVPFTVDKKVISFDELSSKYLEYLQNKENIATVNNDIKKDDWKRYSLSDIRKIYVK